MSSTLGRKPSSGDGFPPEVTERTEVRVEVTPPWPFRLTRRSSMDGLTRVRNGVLHRLLHVEQQPVLVRVAQLSSGDVLFGARSVDASAAHAAIVMMRRALGVDLELAPFHARYRNDPLIGPAIRANPTLRPAGRPYAFEALACAITEQLIEFERAAAIQRRITARLGRSHAGFRDSATAAALSGAAPAELAAYDLAPKRAIALIRAAREVASGRVDLEHDHEAGWRRLAAIPEIGPWTLEMLALTGQGRLDRIPAGDLGFIKAVGRHLHGHPYARAEEAEVRDLFARFGPWQGLAGAYFLAAGGCRQESRGGVTYHPPTRSRVGRTT